MGQISLAGQALAVHNITNNGFIYRSGDSGFAAALSGATTGIGVAMVQTSPPANSSAAGVAGQIAYQTTAGSTFFYVCTATGTATGNGNNRWGRVALGTF